MVFSPLILFIILLLALVIVIWFYGVFGENPVIEILDPEPFVSFEHSMKAGATIPSSSELPPYSGNHPNKNIAKVYDNVFYDINNGNLIEIDSPSIDKKETEATPTATATPTPTATPTATATPTSTATATTKTSVTTKPETSTATTKPGSTNKPESFETQCPQKKNAIDNIWISCRKDAGNPVVHYPGNAPAVTPESQLELVNSYNHFVYNTKSKQTDPYAVLYIGWLDGTFITMINLKTNQLVTTQLFSTKGTTSTTLLYNQSELKPLTTGTQITIDNNRNNNTYVILKKYDEQVHVFQLSSNIYFDTRNAQLIVLDPTKDSIAVFNRIGTLIENGYLNHTSYEASPVFNSWDFYDYSGTKMVIYISYVEVTLIVLLEADQKGSYRIFNVQRFDNKGVDSGNSTEITRPKSKTPETTTVPTTTPKTNVGGNTISSFPTNSIDSISMENSKDMMNDYYQWFYHWVKNGKKDSSKRNHMYSEDYMLKTQIVPPVCPACSTSLGTCVNCSSGNTFTGGDSMFYNPWLNFYSKDKNMPTITTKNNGMEEDCDLCSECSEERPITTPTTNKFPTTKTNSKFGYNRRKNRYNSGQEEGEFMDELGQGEGEGEFMDGPLGEGEFMDELEEENGQSNNVMDPYSYFNSVPSKGSNFVPILSDFSKFGR